MRVRMYNAYGYIKTATKQGERARERDVAEQNRRRQICLNCTKKKCTGTEECFRKSEAGI